MLQCTQSGSTGRGYWDYGCGNTGITVELLHECFRAHSLYSLFYLYSHIHNHSNPSLYSQTVCALKHSSLLPKNPIRYVVDNVHFTRSMLMMILFWVLSIWLTLYGLRVIFCKLSNIMYNFCVEKEKNTVC